MCIYIYIGKIGKHPETEMHIMDMGESCDLVRSAKMISRQPLVFFIYADACAEYFFSLVGQD